MTGSIPEDTSLRFMALRLAAFGLAAVSKRAGFVEKKGLEEVRDFLSSFGIYDYTNDSVSLLTVLFNLTETDRHNIELIKRFESQSSRPRGGGLQGNIKKQCETTQKQLISIMIF